MSLIKTKLLLYSLNFVKLVMFIGGVARESSTAFLFMSINNLKIYNVMDDAADIQRSEIDMKEEELHIDSIKRFISPFVHKPPFNFRQVVDVDITYKSTSIGEYKFRRTKACVSSVEATVKFKNVVILEYPDKGLVLTDVGGLNYRLNLADISIIKIYATYSDVDNDPSLDRAFIYKREN